MKRSSLVSVILIFSLLFSFCIPSQGWASFLDFSEDTLKSTGIIIGITAGVLLLVVLIVGTVRDVKGDEEDEDIWARLEDTKLDAFPSLLASRDLLCTIRNGFTLGGTEETGEDLPAHIYENHREALFLHSSRFHIGGAGDDYFPEIAGLSGTLAETPCPRCTVSPIIPVNKQQFAFFLEND